MCSAKNKNVIGWPEALANFFLGYGQNFLGVGKRFELKLLKFFSKYAQLKTKCNWVAGGPREFFFGLWPKFFGSWKIFELKILKFFSKCAQLKTKM